MGRSRRRTRLAAWATNRTGRPADAGRGVWESLEVAERFAAAALLGPAVGPRAPAVRPALVLLSGLPGTGKSYLARELASHTSVSVVSSDRVRYLLFARPTYDEEEHAFVHEVCYRMAKRILTAGGCAVIDATNLRERDRRRYQDLAWVYDVPHHVVVVHSAEGTVRTRLQRRSSGLAQDGSHADERVYELMRQTAEPVRHPHLRVRGDEDVSAAVQQVLVLLERDRDAGRETVPAQVSNFGALWQAAGPLS